MKTMEENMRRRQVIYLILFAVAFLTACGGREDKEFALAEVEDISLAEESESGATIFVYVCGAVKYEGVYELPDDCRVYEAIAKAGGLREDAATSTVNQAQLLKDGERLYIPTVLEAENWQEEESGKVNLNTASKEELMTLPGVGASRADSIIKYREKQGNFACIEDIMQVSGIKEGLFEKIKELITI